MRQPTAKWSAQRDVWEDSVRSDELLETLPAWGTTVGGELFALPTPEHLTAARESSSLQPGGGLGLPTPLAHDAVQGLSPAALKRRTPDLPAIALILMRGGASIVWSWRDGLPDWLPWHLILSEGGAGTDT